MSASQSEPRNKPITQDRLCRACSQLDLWRDALLKRRAPAYTGEKQVSLGRIRDVMSRSSCPLCRLSTYMIRCRRKYETTKLDKKQSYLSDDLEIFINHTGGAPKLHVGFTDSEPRAASTFYFLDSEMREDGAEPDITYSLAVLLTTDMIDLRIINKWRYVCERSHKGSCGVLPTDAAIGSAHELGGSRLRFIDVYENCITDGSLNDNYVALSYVWGKVKSLRLLKQNRSDLYERNALEERWDEMPQTIKDAILLTRDLRARYLWVDSLCLVQDDASDMEPGLKLMDLVYECSELTIIAATGPDANSGLPGYTKCSGSRQVVEKVNDLTILSVQDMTYHIDMSEYGKRAWTYVIGK